MHNQTAYTFLMAGGGVYIIGEHHELEHGICPIIAMSILFDNFMLFA